jgi:glutaredoxin
MATARARPNDGGSAHPTIDVSTAEWLPSDPLMTTRPPAGSRLLLIVALIGIGMLGATCKGNETRANGGTSSDPRVAQPSVEQKGTRTQIADIDAVDVSVIEPSRRADFIRLLNDTYCYCGCPRTLAACLSNRAECSCVRCSERMTSFIINEMKEGMSTDDVESQLLDGFSEGYNGRPHDFDTKDQAAKGPGEAKFTIVEFADFRCPHCAAAYEILDDLLSKRSDVRLVYYYFPLGGGGDKSIRAAEAAEEARHQGKFWEYARILFRNQLSTEEDDLVRYAQETGLDVERFKKALSTHVHKEKVLADKRLGESVKVISTPTLFINGRQFGLARTAENLEMRFQMEAERGKCD